MFSLHIISWIFVGFGLLSFIILYVDINMGRYQGMPIMNIAWPITALYSGPLGLYMYFKYGRSNPKKMKKKPHWVSVYISSTHCGAGCGLADIVSEFSIYWIGITFFGQVIWASFFIDYGAALIFGFLFQYFNIKPMRPKATTLELIKDSIKADILSLTSFQLGMYSWLLATFFIFKGSLNAGSVIYWFMMQIGLTLGLLTTYPVNAWLIKTGVKEACAH